ncbi:unnamed protein product [Schistosoma mattheei]|uniref:Leucine carboxyl methyltransferase 1 n=1 Tax=Schistosoma mattheei TaxID=31246 RepID=A0A183P5E2_9TREM|nr:unnamed protein product [Schistosoma mattheei]
MTETFVFRGLYAVSVTRMSSPTDEIIQLTNDDATSSKAHAISRGYWKDKYIRYFCSSPSHKTPEINRGYFIRTTAFRAIAISFIKLYTLNPDASPLKDDNLNLTINQKTSVVDALHDNLHYVFETGRFHLLSFDLRRSVQDLLDVLCSTVNGAGCSKSCPTLFLAECVLVYMSPEASCQLIKGLSVNFPRASFLHYEQVGILFLKTHFHGIFFCPYPDVSNKLSLDTNSKSVYSLYSNPVLSTIQVNMSDSFGSIMIKNFRARSCELPGLNACHSLATQEERFFKAGWKKAKGWTINQVYKMLPSSTRYRVEHLELLDDLEVTMQLFDHYCILLATNDEIICPDEQLKESLATIE